MTDDTKRGVGIVIFVVICVAVLAYSKPDCVGGTTAAINPGAITWTSGVWYCAAGYKP